MAKCGYVWQAPYQAFGSVKVEWKEQKCALPAGHLGDHCSSIGVTTKNKEK